jgi:mannosyltransferase
MTTEPVDPQVPERRGRSATLVRRLAGPAFAIPAGMIMVAVLGLFRIGEKNLWLDEATSWQFATRFLQRLPEVPDVNMTLYYWLLAIWQQLVPDTEAGIRSLSVVFAVVTVPFVYLLARRAFNRYAAAIAVLIFALDVFVIRYAQEARGYSLLILLVVLSTYLFLRAWERGGVVGWVVYGIVAGLGLYVHFFAGLVVAAHAIILVGSERLSAFRPSRLIAAGIVVLLASPLLYAISTRGGCQIAWIDPPSMTRFVAETREIGGQASVYLTMAYIGLSFLAAGIALTRGDARRRRNVILLLLWAVVPVGGALLMSVVQPVFMLRYIVVSLPPLIILSALAVTTVRPRILGAAMLAGIVALTSVGMASWYTRPSEELWEATVAHIVSASGPGDGVIYHTRSGRKPVTYYARQMGATSEMPIEVWTPKEPCDEDPSEYAVELASIGETTRADHARVWLILTHTELWDPPAELESLLAEMEAGYDVVSRATFGVGSESGHLIEVRLYARAREQVASGETGP